MEVQKSRNVCYDGEVNQTTQKYRIAFIYLALTVATLAVFWQVRNFEFINYDDNRYITENQHIRTGLTIDNIIRAFTASHFFMWHPVTSLSHMLDCELFGLNPGRHHTVNLLFHIANTLLLFEILRRMTNHLWAGAFVAAVFALHPLNVESVAWVAERKNVLSGFFWMLTIAAYIRYVKYPRTSNYLMVFSVFSLSLMAKPTTVTLPFALLLLDYWPLDRLQQTMPNENEPVPQFKKLSPWALVKEKIPLFLLSAALSVITIVTQEGGDVLQLNKQLPFHFRLANALISYATYIGKMICPIHLSVFYPHPGLNIPLWQPIASFVLLVAVSVILIYFGRRKPYLTTGWLWFLGTLVPVIGLVQAGGQAMAERYAYIPLTGLFIIIAWGASDLMNKWKYQKIASGILSIAVISALSICAWIQTSYWHDGQRLFEHALKVNSKNYMTRNNLGIIFIEQGKFAEAVEQFSSALQANPNYVQAHQNLGIAYDKMGHFKEEVKAYQNAIKLKPDLFEAYYALGAAYGKLSRFGEQIESYRKALKIKPDYAKVHFDLGVAYGKIGRFEDEIESYRLAVKIKPDFVEAYNNLGVACARIGRFQDSIQAFKKAIELKPDAPDSFYNLGAAYLKIGNFKDAAKAFKQVIKLKPDDASAYFRLGMVYLNLGDKDSAAKQYEILQKLNAEKANTLLHIMKKDVGL